MGDIFTAELAKKIEARIKAKVLAKIEERQEDINDAIEEAVKKVIQKRIYETPAISRIKGIDDDKFMNRGTYASTGAFRNSIYTYYKSNKKKGKFYTEQLLPNSPANAHYSWEATPRDMAKDVPFMLEHGNKGSASNHPVVEYKGRKWMKEAGFRGFVSAKEAIKLILKK